VTVNRPPKAGNYTTDNTAIEVIVAQPQPRFFSGLYQAANPNVRARAVARKNPGQGNGCVLSLAPSGSGAIAVSGNGNLTANNCDVVSDSTDANAIKLNGAPSRMTAPCVVTSGGSPGESGSGTLTFAPPSPPGCTSVTTGAAATADPYAAVPTPAHGATQPSGTCPGPSHTLSPGYYPTGISITGNCTFSAGVYYVNGNFATSGPPGTTITGTGVTFFIAKTSPTTGAVSITGNAAVTFAAPTTGPTAGIVFFGDRAGTTAINNSFGGNGSTSITGVIYFPTETVTYAGNAASGSTCTQLVADLISISGNAVFNDNNCPAGVQTITVADGSPGVVRLVE
jgi:hypothetical protein